MKTRIISGVVMAAVVAAVLVLGYSWNIWVIYGFMAVIAAIGTFELLRNAVELTNKIALAGACIFTAMAVIFINISELDINSKVITVENFSAIYFLFAVIVIIFFHEDFDLERIFAFTLMPLILGYGFARVCSVAVLNNQIYYLLLMLNFSSVCDMGAYFVGSFLGKNKLCPAISPKKTVEGAIGGIVASVIVSLILMFSFGTTNKLLFTLILTVPFCMIGMLGDLFASVIKRSVGLKDYGNLIPGHGGILDRFDSVLLIAPFLYMYASIGVI